MANENERGAPAAQADVLGGDARNTGVPDTTDGRMAPEANQPVPARPQAEDGEARPGKDENQAGFLKDDDKRFAP
jgi:hypothetical protein